MTKPLPCPFCGVEPSVMPETQEAGNAYGYVCCRNRGCFAKPTVQDGELVSDDRGTELYKEAAILRWNKRA